MAERIPAPSELAKTNWNSDGSTYPSTDPGSSKRATGFKPKDVPTPGAGEVIAANDQNWLHGLEMQLHNWLKQFVPREYADVSEGIANTSDVSQLFKVYANTSGMKYRGQLAWNVTTTATGVGVIGDLCTDGEQVYYNAGTGSRYVVAADPTDGSLVWESNPWSTSNPSALCTQGSHVYASVASASYPGLRRLSRTSGAASANGGTAYGHGALAANGDWAVGIDGSPGAGFITFYDTIRGAIAQTGTYDTTSASLWGICIDDNFCYTLGERSTYDVWCNNIVTRGIQWNVALPTTTAPTNGRIATDGNYVYVACDRLTLTAGGSANLFVLQRTTGATVATADIGPSVDMIYIAIDDRYLYLGADPSTCYVVLKRSVPAFGVVTTIPDVITPIVDGVSVVFRDYTTNTNFQRNWMLGATKTFMRADPGDEARRPFHHLAVPVDTIE